MKRAISGASFLIVLQALTCNVNLQAESRKASAISYLELGDEYARQGKLDAAIKAYDIALQFVTDLAPAYFKRGNAYQARGDFESALADYNKTLEIVPQWAEAYSNRAN